MWVGNECYEFLKLTKSSGDMIPGVVKIGGTPAEISGVSQKSRTSGESLSSTGEIGISVEVGAAMSSKNAESD